MTDTARIRSMTAPARGASSGTGRISATTTPVTPNPEPVSSNTSTAIATIWNTSPDRDTVWAVHGRR